MDRIANCKTFTCKSCRQKTPRRRLAMTTSQCGLCLGCYEEGKRIYIDWISQHAYVTLVANSEDLTDPDRPRGSHNLVLKP